ncbi:hypothetical protein DMENIID0001_006130 [Sergentomyia squamirostris]
MGEDKGGGDPPPKFDRDKDKDQISRPSYSYKDGICYNGFRVLVWKKEISPCLVGEILKYKFNEEHVSEITKNGRDSVIVHCKNRETANLISYDVKLIEAGYKPYIPLYYVTSCGLIFDVDQKYEELHIADNLKTGQFKIHSVGRVTRIDNNGIVKTRRIKVYFHGTKVPEYAFFNLVRLQCEPFIPKVVTCGKCWRIGHVGGKCNNPELRCKICLGNHMANACQITTPICAQCSGNHHSTYAQCPERIRQRNIRTAMATRNLSRNEANNLFPKYKRNPYAFNSIVVQNRYAVLEDENYEAEFPPISRNRNQSANRGLSSTNIPAHQVPELPIVNDQHRSRSNTRRPGNHNKGTKRDSSHISDDELLDRAISQAAKERRLLENSGPSQSSQNIGNSSSSKSLQVPNPPHFSASNQSLPNIPSTSNIHSSIPPKSPLHQSKVSTHTDIKEYAEQTLSNINNTLKNMNREFGLPSSQAGLSPSGDSQMEE